MKFENQVKYKLIFIKLANRVQLHIPKNVSLNYMQNFLYLASIERKRHPFKCLTFGATSLENRQPATGDFDGNINLWDVENKQPGTSYIQKV